LTPGARNDCWFVAKYRHSLATSSLPWSNVLLISAQSFLAVQRNSFLDDLTELVKHRFLVGAVASSEHQSGGTPDIALILFRPFDDLGVSGTVFYFFDSSGTDYLIIVIGDHPGKQHRPRARDHIYIFTERFDTLPSLTGRKMS